MNFWKKLFSVFKCAFCSKKECRVRYQLGNRSYYSHLGYVRVACPKKERNYSYLPTTSDGSNHIKEQIASKQDKEQ